MQVLNKAMLEPGSASICARLSHDLAIELPDFTEADPDTGKPKATITFRLNKCQSEFEKGSEAIAAAEERKAKVKEEGEDGKDGKVCMGQCAIAPVRTLDCSDRSLDFWVLTQPFL